jgi:RNA polymerase sigma-70 factor (ECF subfamily)
VEAARSAQPDLDVDVEEFARHVAESARDGALPPLQHAGDLLLAWACARGAPSAVAAFHRAYASVIARVLARRRAAADLADDAAQAVHEMLLCAHPPKIADYQGTGPLRSWVSTAAARMLLGMQRSANRRRESPHEDGDGDAAALVQQVDPELAFLKQRYKADVEGAIVRALERLDDRARTLLRLHFGEGMSIDRLGDMYRVNRATAARWLAAARETLVEGARDEIQARLRLSEKECDSIVRLMRSQLDVSLMRHLSPATR